MIKISAVTLGCDKNRVDTEKMLASLSSAGYSIVSSVEEADLAIINTCAFIDSAKKESIDTIFEIADLKKDNLKYLVVAGCFSERYLDAMSEFDEVDAYLGIDNRDKIVEVVNSLTGQKTEYDCDSTQRVLTTPQSYAYLKIADGCNNCCTYCAIPRIRGRYRSEKIEDLIKEATLLADSGVKELIVVAQDTTRYGEDLYGKKMLIPLLEQLSTLSFRKIRLLYAYPESVTRELVEFVSKNDKMAKYLDIPLQHISSTILKRMNRRIDENGIRQLVKMIKTIDPRIVIRSSFIVGFPGETEEDFQMLKEFIAEGNIDYAGFFEYSREEGTPAYRMDAQLAKRVKKARRIELEKIESKIVEEKHSALLGKDVEVVFEDVDMAKGAFVGRLDTQAPLVDPVVILSADFPIEQGKYYLAKVQKTGFYIKANIYKELVK